MFNGAEVWQVGGIKAGTVRFDNRLVCYHHGSCTSLLHDALTPKGLSTFNVGVEQF